MNPIIFYFTPNTTGAEEEFLPSRRNGWKKAENFDTSREQRGNENSLLFHPMKCCSAGWSEWGGERSEFLEKLCVFPLLHEWAFPFWCRESLSFTLLYGRKRYSQVASLEHSVIANFWLETQNSLEKRARNSPAAATLRAAPATWKVFGCHETLSFHTSASSLAVLHHHLQIPRWRLKAKRKVSHWENHFSLNINGKIIQSVNDKSAVPPRLQPSFHIGKFTFGLSPHCAGELNLKASHRVARGAGWSFHNFFLSRATCLRVKYRTI